MALAIVLAAGGALANSFTRTAPEVKQYYKTSTGKYLWAGTEGVDYLCEFDHFGTCTYTLAADSVTYKSSKGGKIVWLR